jgi:hypothetical protein
MAVVGMIAGMALGFAGYFGGFPAFLLVAALGLYDLMLGEEGASVVVAAVDERQAGIVFKTAARMVELSAGPAEQDELRVLEVERDVRVHRQLDARDLHPSLLGG